MSGTNVSLSADELSLVGDASWVRMKQGIIHKVYELFALSAKDLDSCFSEKGVYEIYNPAISSPKISKGENYLGLPWVMLDHPRDFGGEDVFSVRTFFWWGNFFSIGLHLEGRFKRIFIERLKGAGELPADLHFCVSDSPWHHYFERDNLLPVHSPEGLKALNESGERPFLKWVLKYELGDWNQMQDLLRGGYQKMAGLLV